MQSVDVPDATLTALITVTLPTKGTWLIRFVADWQKNSSGGRFITTSNNLVNATRGSAISTIPVSFADTYMEMIYIHNNVNSTLKSFTLNGYQSSGSTLSCYPYAVGIKLSD